MNSGRPVTFSCEVSHKNIITYWTLDNIRLANTTRRYQIGTNLHITRADRVRDEGEYRCVAENKTSGNSIVTTPAKLEVRCK